MKTLLLTVGIVITLSGPALSAQTLGHTKAHPRKTALICPVTGEKFASTKTAAGHSMYKGKTFYFCCAGCKPRFDKNPAGITKNARAGKFEKM